MSERDLLAKTLMAEAGNQGPLGMLAVGSVIMNRANQRGYGDGIQGVIMKPGQFSPWNSVTGYAGGEQGQDMAKIQPTREAYQIADALMSGEYDDPTGGATHFYNPDISQPKWGRGGDWLRIGDHVFGRADAGKGDTQMTPQRGLLAQGPTISTRGQTPDAVAQVAPQGRTPIFQNKDLMARLAMAFNSMRLNPDPNLAAVMQSGIQQRAEQSRAEQQRSRTADWLESQGLRQLAQGVRSGALTGQEAMAMATKKSGQVLTAAQVNEMYPGADVPDGGLYSLSASGTLTKVGGGPQTVIDMGAGKMGDEFGKAVYPILDAGSKARSTLMQLSRLEELLANAPQGAAGTLVQAANNFGISVKGGDEVAAATALINSLVPQQRPAGSGPMSDADLELFKQSLPRIINQPGGNKLILDTLRRIAEYDIQRADIVARGLEQGATPQQLLIEVFRLENPIPPELRSGGAPNTSSGAAGDELTPDDLRWLEGGQ